MPARNFFFIVTAILVCYICYNVAVKNRYARLFSEAITIVERQALHDVPPDELFQSAMQGMLKGFDQHSEFISGQSFNSLNEDLEGAFGGVGIYFEPIEKQGILVLAVVPGKPADQAGLKAGDIITAIDDESAIDCPARNVRNRMTGPLDVSLKIDYLRDGALNTATVHRARIAMKSIHGLKRNTDGTWDHTIGDHQGLAYIRLTQFDKASADEMAETLESLGPQTTGIILDVRSNGGGLLTAAERICDMFLEPGLSIVKIKGRKGLEVREAVSLTQPLVADSVNVVVLINRHSASASEVVAACLQDHGRAVVIGEQSWGKGTVQNIIPMQLGSSALKLTTFSYWPPSGRPIDRYNKAVIETKQWGVFPDQSMTVPQAPADVACLMKKLHLDEIAGLIPPEKRQSILEVTIENFLRVVNQKGVFDQPLQDADQHSDIVKEPTKPNAAAQTLDTDALPNITREDLQSDAVLEKAIEFLSRPAALKRRAA